MRISGHTCRALQSSAQGRKATRLTPTPKVIDKRELKAKDMSEKGTELNTGE
jgi:hypothetical protein